MGTLEGFNKTLDEDGDSKMPALIDTIAYAGQRPWHGLGRELSDVQTADAMIGASGLDWTVRKERIAYNGKPTEFYFTVREDANAVLGVVGQQYRILQNRDAFRLVDDVMDDSGAKYETAGSLREGRQVWALARLPEDIMVAGTDAIRPYFLVSNSHDGSRCLTIGLTPIRVVCWNTLTAAIGFGKQRMERTLYLVHKDRPIAEAVRRAKNVLPLAYRYFKSFEELANTLVSVSITDGEFETFLKTLFPAEGKRAETSREEITALLDAPTNKNFKGTAWGAYNALTEWYDHRTRGLRTKDGVSGDIKVERSLLDTQGWKRNTLDSLLRSKEDHTAVKALLESLKKS